MSVPLLDAKSAPSGPRQLPAENRSPARFAWSAQDLRARALDAIVVVWLGIFQHVLGVHYRFARMTFDEHYFLNEGWSVLKGQIPYRDFQEFKPPVIFFVNALGIELFGLEGLGYRKLLSLLSLAGFLALTSALLSRRVHRLLVVATIMLMIDHFCDDTLHTVINDAETLALDFFLMGVGVLLLRTKWERTQQVLGGALLALSPLSKEPVLYAVGCAWLALLLLHRTDSGRRGAARHFALFTLAGVAGVAATWLVYLLATRSLFWYVLQLKLTFAYARNYWYQVQGLSRSPQGGAFVNTLRQLAKAYLNASHLAVFIPFFVALVTLSRKRSSVALLALASFAAALYGVSIGQGFLRHYFVMAMTGTFFCVALGALALDAAAKRSCSDLWRWAGASAGLGIVLVLTLPRFAAEWDASRTYQAEPPPVDPSDIDFVHAHTSPGDKIWTTDDPLLYVFSDRVSAFRGGIVLDEIIENYPGDSDEERLSVIRDGLEENRPKLVVLGNKLVGARRKQRYLAALVLPFLRDGRYIQLDDRFYLRPD